MFFLKKINQIKALRLASGLPLIIFLIFSIVFMPKESQAQIVVFDPVTAGIQSIIKTIDAANTAIQAAESHIEVELSALKYVRQGQQLMNQIQQLQQESSSLIGAVNNIEGTVMMPANELAGLKNTLTGEEATMKNIINLEKNNPQMQGFLQNYQGTYGDNNLLNSNYYQARTNQYQNNGVQAAQTAAYGQALLNNSQNNQHLISQLGSNVASAKGTVAVGQANGQALVTIAEEINQLNKLEAMKAKLLAMQTAAKDSKKEAIDKELNAPEKEPAFVLPSSGNLPSGGSSPFGSYPNVTNFK